jgi:hypothetical protein
MKSTLRTRAAALALAGAATLGGGAVAAHDAATAPAAEAASYSRTINCGTTGYAAIKVTNYYSPYSTRMYVYNASNGAYYGSLLVPGGGSKVWETSLRNARVVVNGNGIVINGWCSY